MGSEITKSREAKALVLCVAKMSALAQRTFFTMLVLCAAKMSALAQ
ncbi:hypothetical protein LEP1GSC048_0536 [Leptospira santarosai serovar Shermani str. 1342KT]|nr:hypothetical protein LEP1GSC048_0536 [Leptospira santarosai serovar Shermani str. 1342KT]